MTSKNNTSDLRYFAILKSNYRLYNICEYQISHFPQVPFLKVTHNLNSDLQFFGVKINNETIKNDISEFEEIDLTSSLAVGYVGLGSFLGRRAMEEKIKKSRFYQEMSEKSSSMGDFLEGFSFFNSNFNLVDSTWKSFCDFLESSDINKEICLQKVLKIFNHFEKILIEEENAIV